MHDSFTPHVTVFWPISHDFADIELKIGTFDQLPPHY